MAVQVVQRERAYFACQSLVFLSWTAKVLSKAVENCQSLLTQDDEHVALQMLFTYFLAVGHAGWNRKLVYLKIGALSLVLKSEMGNLWASSYG